MRMESIGLIGFGAIGGALADLLRAEAPSPLRVVLTRQATIPETRKRLPASVRIVADLDAFLGAQPDLIVECAGQDAVRAHAPALLSAGRRLMVVSTGALAGPGFLESLMNSAAPGAQLIVPAGAIAGLDGLGALKLAGLTGVTYTSTKPPLAWCGTPAESLLDLKALDGPVAFFDGSAREAALSYPKNANLAATVALAGLGFDRTRVQLVADPRVDGNVGQIDAESEIGSLRVTMSGRASANPKTSASVAYSLLHAIRTRSTTLVI